MIRIRPYKDSDADEILSWNPGETEFYNWTAGVLGDYPMTYEKFQGASGLMRFTAIDEKEVVGFFTARNPKDTLDELRFGFVIVKPSKRGTGCGKAMLELGIRYAFDIYQAKKVSLGVFADNPSAYHCYLAAGFREVPQEEPEVYTICGKERPCLEMEILRPESC